MRLCCEKASTYICGAPGLWDFGDNNPAILFCPYCGTKLPEKYISNFEVVVRFDRGLGAEFKKLIIEADTQTEAKIKGEKEAGDLLVGSKFKILGSQVTPIKPA